jgi:hypothetical protein
VARPTPTPRPGRPGELLLHPLAILAVVVLVLNDHFLKALAPGLLTGKLSDFAGLLFFPVLAVSAVEIGALGLHRGPPDRHRLVLGSVAATALAFGLVKTTSLGTAVFAWSLGAAQWLVTAGPVRGDGPHPAMVMTDPGDLVALAALVGTLWVARGSSRFRLPRIRRRSTDAHRQASRSAVLVLVFASLATMATGGGARPVQQLVSTSYEERIHLDADHLAAVRHLSFEVDNNDPQLRQILLSAAVPPNETQLEVVAPAVVMTLLPDPPAGKITSNVEGNGAAFTGLPALDLTDSCSASCRHGATLVARLDGPAPAAGLDFTLQVSLWAFGGYGDAKLDTKLALHNDAARAFEGNPTSVMTKTQGRYTITTAAPKAKVRMEIHIAADALRAPLVYPLVATVSFFLTGDKLESADVPNTYATVGGMQVRLFDGSPRTSVDLLSLCKAGRACQIPVVISSEYSPQSPSVPGATPLIGSARQTWHIEARLEAYDGRPLPKGAISLGKPSP